MTFRPDMNKGNASSEGAQQCKQPGVATAFPDLTMTPTPLSAQVTRAEFYEQQKAACAAVHPEEQPMTDKQTAIDASALLATIEDLREARAQRMPTERDAIRAMFDAWQRLTELGWMDGRYMPETGERFAGIQNGSTGIHAMTAEREDAPLAPKRWWVHDGDMWPSSQAPLLYRQWREDDVQPNLRVCAPIPVDQPPPRKSLLREPLKPGERLVCYCPPGICQAPPPFRGPCNRATGSNP